MRSLLSPSREFRLLSIALIVLAGFFAEYASASSHDDLCVDLLPEDAQTVLKAQFPEFYPQKVSDLSREYQQAWLKDHPQECPGIAVGHFQSSSKTSYAVLLVGSRGSLSGSKLVVLSETPKGWKAAKLAEKPVEYNYEAVAKLSRKGAPDRIQLKEFDGGSSVYAWAGGRFHRTSSR
ncbi:MAG TPA: hypothetical protein VJQ82_24465 [Terriglobales bacterium]|nr:hypothetical protein [Terriglobales bacterium]